MEVSLEDTLKRGWWSRHSTWQTHFNKSLVSEARDFQAPMVGNQGASVSGRLLSNMREIGLDHPI